MRLNEILLCWVWNGKHDLFDWWWFGM